LELLDLVRRPALRHADQRVGDRALGKIIELPELAAQRDVDGHQHLLHRRITVDAVGAHVARPVDDVARRIVDRGQAFEHLLIGRRIDRRAVGCGKRLRRAPPIVDQPLDGGAVELSIRLNFETVTNLRALIHHPAPSGSLICEILELRRKILPLQVVHNFVRANGNAHIGPVLVTSQRDHEIDLPAWVLPSQILKDVDD
jgi:hypothetical protein